MVTAKLDHELEMDYEVSYRELSTPGVSRDMSSKERFRANARFTRGGKNRQVSGAHRRRDKRNYL